MELKHGKIALPPDERLKFTNGMSTLICADGMIYILSDARLQKAAEEIDKMPPAKAAQMTRALFGSATSARVSKKGVIRIKDSPAAMALLDGKPFGLRIEDDGLALLIPEGVDTRLRSFWEIVAGSQ